MHRSSPCPLIPAESLAMKCRTVALNRTLQPFRDSPTPVFPMKNYVRLRGHFGSPGKIGMLVM